MSHITVAPLQWSNVEDIDDVEPLNERDADCLAEIREVLRKHNMMDRFGVALLHSHFEVANDEILLETTSKEERTLITKPVKAEDYDEGKVGTIWKLEEGDVVTMAFCKSYCYRTTFGRHTKHHRRVKE